MRLLLVFSSCLTLACATTGGPPAPQPTRAAEAPGAGHDELAAAFDPQPVKAAAAPARPPEQVKVDRAAAFKSALADAQAALKAKKPDDARAAAKKATSEAMSLDGEARFQAHQLATKVELTSASADAAETAARAWLAACGAVVKPGEGEQPQRRAHAGIEHVALRVPHVALRAEEGVTARGVERERRAPLEQLVERREAEDDVDEDEDEPAVALELRLAQQHLAHDEDGKQAEREVADLVVVVARPAEGHLRPLPQRRLRVRVVAAVHENEDVHEHRDVDEAGHREALPRQREGDEPDQTGANLEQPVELAFGRGEEGEREDHEEHRSEGERQAGIRSHRREASPVVTAAEVPRRGPRGRAAARPPSPRGVRYARAGRWGCR